MRDSLRVLLPLLPSILLILRLAGYGRSWLPSPLILGLLIALAHVIALASPRRAGPTRAFFRRHAFSLALAALVALALVVRLPGIGADLGHTPLDIDENRLAASVKHFFDTGAIDHRTVEHYPGAVFWLFAAASFVHYVRGLTNGIELPPDQVTIGNYVLAARTANVFVAAAIVWLTGLIGRRVAGGPAGLLAAGLVAFVPLSIETTTVVRNDPGMLLAVIGAVYAALLFHDTKQSSWAIVGGLLAGIATAIKYSSLFALVPVLIATAAEGTARERLERSALAAMAFVAAVAVTNHFVWWDFPNFLRQLTAQVALTASGHWAATQNPSAFYMVVLSRFGPGIVLVALAGVFTVYALCTRRMTLWIVLSFPLLYLSFMTQRPAQFPRWVFPLVPFVSIASTAALAAGVRAIGGIPAPRRGRGALFLRAIPALVVIAATAQPVWNGLVAFSRRVTPPTHALAEQWLESHAAPDSVVASDLHFLDFTGSKLKVRRLDFETVMPAGAIQQIAGADWLVVPEPYFGNPMLRRLGFVQRFHADRSFAGHMGYDYEIYAVPKIPENGQ
jgi:4-amino-4-deoxy-L-arabinose transferase-like glycosyltransferase